MHDCPYMSWAECKCFKCTHYCKCSHCDPNCENAECYAFTHSAIREVPKMSNPDPNSYIQASAQALAQILASKNSDYAPEGEFSNFERAAEFCGARTLGVVLAQVGIKFTRIETLSRDVYAPSPQHESLKDSLLDLAGYATIAHAYLEYLDGEMPTSGAPKYTTNMPRVTLVESREEIRNIDDGLSYHGVQDV